MTEKVPAKRKPVWRTWIVLSIAGAVAVVGVGAFGILFHIHSSTRPAIFQDVEAVPARPVAIVLGAGLNRDGSPTPALAERVIAAAELYRAGKVRKLLLTGDNRFAWYNEPAAMGQLALELGVPAEDIVYDYAGRRTYDSCYRARHIFGLTDAVVVTQGFHLPRALYLCRHFGIDAVGADASRGVYDASPYVRVREMAARLAAWVDVHIRRPTPVLGEPITIELD